MCTRTPVMVGKSTTRAAHRGRVPALLSHVRPAHSVAPHSSHAPPAVGRTREEIHRGPIENNRRAPRARTNSTASARIKLAGSLARAKAAPAVAVAGRIGWAVGQVAPRGRVVVVSVDFADGDRERNKTRSAHVCAPNRH